LDLSNYWWCGEMIGKAMIVLFVIAEKVGCLKVVVKLGIISCPVWRNQFW